MSQATVTTHHLFPHLIANSPVFPTLTVLEFAGMCLRVPTGEKTTSSFVAIVKQLGVRNQSTEKPCRSLSSFCMLLLKGPSSYVHSFIAVLSKPTWYWDGYVF